MLGITIGPDATTHCQETYESQYANLITESGVTILFLRIYTAQEHTSEAQLEN